jgi:hypothetical protein
MCLEDTYFIDYDISHPELNTFSRLLPNRLNVHEITRV